MAARKSSRSGSSGAGKGRKAAARRTAAKPSETKAETKAAPKKVKRRTLDRVAPFGRVIPRWGKVAFEQDGVQFDFDGNEVFPAEDVALDDARQPGDRSRLDLMAWGRGKVDYEEGKVLLGTQMLTGEEPKNLREALKVLIAKGVVDEADARKSL